LAGAKSLTWLQLLSCEAVPLFIAPPRLLGPYGGPMIPVSLLSSSSWNWVLPPSPSIPPSSERVLASSICGSHVVFCSLSLWFFQLFEYL
jgi:hypothetical protein